VPGTGLLGDQSGKTEGAEAKSSEMSGQLDQQKRITNELGPFPELEKTKAKRDDWTTRALIGPLWEGGVPPFSLLWLSEPDYSQHETGPGSATSLAMLKNSDDNLALVLQELEAKGLRAKTDIFVVSDHGFSTISSIADVAEQIPAMFDPVGSNLLKPDERIVPGGGVALIRASNALDALKLNGDEAVGVEIIRKACFAPATAIANN
jgi:hypothetical protein